MILLDTHAWIWWATRQLDRLTESVGQKITASPGQVSVASVSCLEAAMLVKKGRIRVAGDMVEWFSLALEGSGIHLLPLTPAIAARSVSLPDIHRDPIDRVIIARANEHDAVLLTKDSTMGKYPLVRTEWDSAVP